MNVVRHGRVVLFVCSRCTEIVAADEAPPGAPRLANLDDELDRIARHERACRRVSQ